MSWKLHGYGNEVICGRCKMPVRTVYALSATEGRDGNGLCQACYHEFVSGVPLVRIPGIGAVREMELHHAGVWTADDLAMLSDERIAELVQQAGSLSDAQIRGWRDAAKALLAQYLASDKVATRNEQGGEI